MRFASHSYTSYTWTMSDYGEPVKIAGSSGLVHMKIGWNAMTDQASEGSMYQDYDFVGLTRETIPLGSIVDEKYEVKHIEGGRINRVFMNYAEGVEREYEQPQGDSV